MSVGGGVSALLEGKEILVGSEKFFHENNVNLTDDVIRNRSNTGTNVLVAIDKKICRHDYFGRHYSSRCS